MMVLRIPVAASGTHCISVVDDDIDLWHPAVRAIKSSWRWCPRSGQAAQRRCWEIGADPAACAGDVGWCWGGMACTMSSCSNRESWHLAALIEVVTSCTVKHRHKGWFRMLWFGPEIDFLKDYWIRCRVHLEVQILHSLLFADGFLLDLVQ